MTTTNRDQSGREVDRGGTYRPKGPAALEFSPDRTVLLVIDPVNDFLSEGGAGWEMTQSTVKKHDVIGPRRSERRIG